MEYFVYQSDHIPTLGPALAILLRRPVTSGTSVEYHVFLPNSPTHEIVSSKVLRATLPEHLRGDVGEEKHDYAPEMVLDFALTIATRNLQAFVDNLYLKEKDPAFLRNVSLSPADPFVFRRLFYLEEYKPMIDKLYQSSADLKNFIGEMEWATPMRITSPTR